MYEDREADAARRSGSVASTSRWTNSEIAKSANGPPIGRLKGGTAVGARPRRSEVARAEAEAQRYAYLLSAAGHDLRQPLQVMLLALQRVAPVLEDTDSAEWLRIAKAMAATLTESLTDLEHAARLSGAESRTFQLGAVLRTAAASWRHHADIRGVGLTVVDTRVEICSDQALLMSAVRNLVGNAVVQSSGGRVLLGVRRVRRAIRIDVLDTGPELSPGQVERFFEPREREEDQMAGRLGLALAIVRDAAERLGGVLTVTSAPGCGARFSLELPRSPARPLSEEVGVD